VHVPERALGVGRQLAAAIAVVALLVGVGTLAALTGTAKKHTPVVRASRPAVAPPTVVFSDAGHGWAFYPDCERTLPTDGCPPRLFHTTDAGQTWAQVNLPIGVPTTTALWGRMQASGDAVVLPWEYGVYMSPGDGANWSSPALLGQTTTVAKDWFVVRENDQLVLATPAAGLVQSLRPAIPVTPPWDLGVFGRGRVWIRDASRFAVSDDGGKSWNKSPVSSSDFELVVASPSGDRLARLQIALDRMTLGLAGDRGVSPVHGVLVSADAGVTWQTRVVGGPPVNGACTVMMSDGSLLGVAVDGTTLLRLTPGSTTFAPVAGGPATVPACLSSTAGLVYGPTFAGGLVLSPDGRTWHSAKLPARR
jgi:photosystem II stability/assembly factor-like uncharacterized protein